MPQFTYTPYVNNPATNSISELMLRRGDIAARQAEQVGAIQAHAAQQSGQAMAGAVANIGQIASAVPGQMQQQRIQQQTEQLRGQQLQEGALQLSTAQRVEQTRAQINALASDPSVFNEDGTFNMKGIVAKMQQVPGGGAGPVQPPDLNTIAGIIDPINASLTKARDAKLAFEDHKTNALARIASSAFTLGSKDGTFLEHAQLGLAAALKSGLITQQESNAFLVPMVEHPEGVPQMLQHLAALSTLPPIKLGDGDKLLNPLNPSQVLADNPKSPTQAELAVQAAKGDPIATSAMDRLKPTPKKTFEQKNVTLDGKANRLVNFDPATGQMFIPGSDQPIDAARVQANTPPSIVIHNERDKAPNLPAWATDDSRPAAADANKFDPSIRMTPNGLYQAAVTYIATGQFPPTGRGSDATAVAQRSAITSKVGAIAAASGMDEPALRAFYKANGQSLTQQQKAYDAVQSFMATADRNADLLEKTLAKIPDAGSALLNQPLRSISQKAFGNVSVSEFKTYLQSVQNEYARIISQPNLAGQLTDSARHEATTLLDPNATVSQIVASLHALRNEGSNRLLSVGEQIQRIQGRMNGPSDNNAGAASIKVGGFTVVVKK